MSKLIVALGPEELDATILYSIESGRSADRVSPSEPAEIEIDFAKWTESGVELSMFDFERYEEAIYTEIESSECDPYNESTPYDAY